MKSNSLLPPKTTSNANREKAMMMRKQNFILGDEQTIYGTQSRIAHTAHPVSLDNHANNRAELKSKMQTA